MEKVSPLAGESGLGSSSEIPTSSSSGLIIPSSIAPVLLLRVVEGASLLLEGSGGLGSSSEQPVSSSVRVATSVPVSPGSSAIPPVSGGTVSCVLVGVVGGCWSPPVSVAAAFGATVRSSITY